MTSVLEIKQINKTINSKPLIKDITLTLNRGEILGFLGPNGAGKTTLIKMLVGLIKPTSGNIKICGFDINKNRDEALMNIGAIVENPEMYPFMSGYANLKHFANMSSKTINRKRINEIIKSLEMENYIKKKVSTYSLGMKQRLGLAQALLHDPDLLILDEPTNGLDPEGIKEFRKYIKYLSESLGKSILISSHMLSEIELVSSRIAIIKKGELIEVNDIDNMKKTVSNYDLKLDKSKEAINVLTMNGVKSVLMDSNTIRVQVVEENIPSILTLLSSKSINTYSVVSVKESLEEHYFGAISNVGGK